MHSAPSDVDTPPVPTSVRSMTESSPAVTYTLEGGVAVIRVDDGKANALSHVPLDGSQLDPRADDGPGRRPGRAARASSPPGSTSR